MKASNIMTSAVATIAALTIVTQAYAAPDVYSLGVPDVQQEETNWCWAGSSISVLGYNDIDAFQDDFVRSVKGSVVNRTASFSEVKRGLAGEGLSSTFTSDYLSFSTLKSKLYNGDQPVMAGIKWTSGGGHMVVIDGYDDDSTNYIEYMDPWDGDHYVKSYSSFRSSSSQTWIESLHDFN
ncbi:papain-like cysteine protease family protein [Brevibacillus sp. NRS-1366]|uniref:papain-like cysteine protease family protein n=1 Tax=Brevibacillus sp. NRS-1366 TaxID=3233899 RepID=UPI003D24C966